MKRAILALLIIALVGAGAAAYYLRRNGGELRVNTAPIVRGDIVDTVGSTGTLQAVTTVQVGSQVSGNISWLGADFNSIVRKGQMIAKLDPSLFEAQVLQAKANLAKSQADVERNKVALADAQQKYQRAKELGARQLLAQSELDASKVAVDSAQAQLQSSEATVEQAQASLNQNQVNLEHTIISAPIDGIVTQRSVDVGQTVAASMQAPTLFILAADLTKMQVNANIDEADVGRIRPGQHVTFRVDAYPGEEFEGTVVQIRLQPVIVQNVTTYGTIIDVPNKDLKLKPGMTANLRVEIGKATDVLRVPNTALRFRPTSETFAAMNQPVPPEIQSGGRGGRGGQGTNPSASRGGGRDFGNGRGSQAPGIDESSGPAPFARSQGGGRTGQGGQDDPERQARMLERFKTMSPAEQKQFVERIKSRGGNTKDFEKLLTPAAPKRPITQPKYGAPQSASTIDALFAPLPPIESTGRVWLYIDKQLKPVRSRFGITDGTYTELRGDDLEPGMEVVTSVVLPGASTRPALTGFGGGGNPMMPFPGGRGPGGFGGGGFGGPGGGRGR